jgi:DNA primase
VSFTIDNEVKDQVRLATNIVDVVGGYVELRRQGRNFVAICPFHDDRRPSMQVNTERQIWKCWVCDIGGDVFSFLMKKEGVTFPEALRMLAERAGIKLEERKGKFNGSSSDDKKLLFETMSWAVQQFHHTFLNEAEAESARAYIRDRGISDDSVKTFRLGYAPDSWSWLMDRAASQRIKPEIIEAVGLAAKSERGSRYDRFRGRAIFPICDAQSRPIAVGGRILPGGPTDSAKYINCNETRLYHKSHQLYGLDLAKDAITKSRQAIVMEGYTDVIMAVQHGITNAVACCGTALGESHIKLLKRYCDSVVLLLDGDDAGQRRTSEILELFVTAQMDLRILTLPDGLDPCDYLLKNSGDELRELLGGAVDALEHKLRTVCNGFDPLLDTHRANVALEDILQTMSRVSHSSLLSNEAMRLRQDQLISRLGRQFGIEQSEVRLRLDSIRKQALDRARQRQELSKQRTLDPNRALQESADDPTEAYAPKQIVAPKQNTVRYGELNGTECELFEIMALDAALAPMAIERFPIENLSTHTAKEIFQLYLDLELVGHALDFESVLVATEDSDMKSVLVSIEDHASRKSPFANMTPEQRLHSLCERLTRHDDKAQRRIQIQSLERKQLDEMAELQLLHDIVQQARVRHGFFPNQE